MKWYLSKFSDSLVALNHLFKSSNSIFISFLKSSILKLVNIILVSFANKTGLEFPLIAFDKSFTQRKKFKGPKIDPYGTQCFLNPQSKKAL